MKNSTNFEAPTFTYTATAKGPSPLLLAFATIAFLVIGTLFYSLG